MRSPGDILLVSCYELGHQPLSLAWPLAILAEAGFQPRAVDTAVQSLDDGAVRRAKLVAISVPMHTAMRLGADLARCIRELNPEAHLTFYGLYACLNAEHLFGSGLADSVIGGEFEQPLVRLALSLENGAAPAKGVRYPPDGARPPLERQSWPSPRRDGLPGLTHYAKLLRDGEAVLAGYVEATRGCKHTCSHCPITPVYGGRFFAIPREVVLADIRNQVAAGARHITFGDPDFLNGPTHSLRIVRGMHAEFPELTFDATIKIEHILRHADLLPELHELGCAFIVSAVESLSDAVLERLRKGHTAQDVDHALEVMASAGIPLRPTFVPFTPWATRDDYLRLLHWVQQRNLIDSVDPVQYAIRLLIPPGSALLENAGEWLGPLDPAAFSYCWRHPDPSMDALHAEVSAIVERSEVDGRDTWDTFVEVSGAAHRVAGREPGPLAGPPRDRRRPPRLSESWFC